MRQVKIWDIRKLLQQSKYEACVYDEYGAIGRFKIYLVSRKRIFGEELNQRGMRQM